MNRANRRKFVMEMRKQGISKNVAEAYLAIKEQGLDKPRKPLRDGDKVMLNVEQIMRRKDYEKMNLGFKDIVESSADVVFTAHVEENNLVSFEEQPEWLFWDGDVVSLEGEVEVAVDE